MVTFIKFWLTDALWQYHAASARAGNMINTSHRWFATNPTHIPSIQLLHNNIGVSDTQIDSIQYLNFAKKWFNSIFNSIVFHENSIQKIIQFNIFHKKSIQKIIQFKNFQKNQFNRKFNSINGEVLILVESW